MNKKEEQILEGLSQLLITTEISAPIKPIEEKREKQAREKRLLEHFEKTLQKIKGVVEEQQPEPEPIVEEVIQEKSFVDAALANAKTITQPTYQVPEPQPKLPEKQFVTPEVEKLNKGEQIPAGLRSEIDTLKNSVLNLHHFASRISQMGGGGAGDVNDLYCRTIAVNTSYTATNKDYYIGVNSPTSCTITLPVVKQNGFKIIIKDESGNCATNNITVAAPAGSTIDNDTSAIMAVNNMALQLIYRNGWRII